MEEKKEQLKFRDRKQSISSHMKAGVDLQNKSYSKEGKRLDYHSFDTTKK